jgi:hypothetical protein
MQFLSQVCSGCSNFCGGEDPYLGSHSSSVPLEAVSLPHAIKSLHLLQLRQSKQFTKVNESDPKAAFSRHGQPKQPEDEGSGEPTDAVTPPERPN